MELKMKFLIMIAVLMTTTHAFAAGTTLYRKVEGKIEAITLNNLNLPQSSDSEKQRPNILEFNTEEYLKACYVGPVDEALKLVQALVTATDLGAEASAKTVKLWANKQGRIRAEVAVDYGNKTILESYKFTPCN
jgi:hypothetical protein